MDNLNVAPNTANTNNTATSLSGAGGTMPAQSAAPVDNQAQEVASPAVAPVSGADFTPTDTTPGMDPAIEMGTSQPQENLNMNANESAPVEAAPAPEAPVENSFSQASSVNMELGGEVPAASVTETAPMQSTPSTSTEPQAAPVSPNPEQELNIPPEIAAAKTGVQNAPAAQAQTQPVAAAASSKFPLIRIIIIAAAILVLVGGYFAYRYFVKGPSSASESTFISE